MTTTSSARPAVTRPAGALLALLLGLAMTMLQTGPARSAEVPGAITDVTITNTKGGTEITQWSKVRIDASWAVPDDTPAGSTFVLSWTGPIDGTGANFPLKNEAGDTVATCVRAATSVTCTLTDYVTTHPKDISGHLYVTAKQTDVKAGEPVTVTFEGKGGPLDVPYTPGEGSTPGSVMDGKLHKRGWLDAEGYVQWRVELPAGPDGTAADYADAVITDTLGQYQTLRPGSVRLMVATKLGADGQPRYADADPSTYTVVETSTGFTIKTDLAKGSWYVVRAESKETADAPNAADLTNGVTVTATDLTRTSDSYTVRSVEGGGDAQASAAPAPTSTPTHPSSPVTSAGSPTTLTPSPTSSSTAAPATTSSSTAAPATTSSSTAAPVVTTTTSAPAPQGDLAYTGAEVAGPLAAGLALLTGGGLMTALARRRRQH